MMAPRKTMMGTRRGPPPNAGPDPQGKEMMDPRMAPKMGVGTPPMMAPKMGVGTSPMMAASPRMRMDAQTMGTAQPVAMKKGGMAKKGMNYGGMAENGMKKGGKVTPKLAKGGMAKKGGMMLIIGIGKKKGK